MATQGPALKLPSSISATDWEAQDAWLNTIDTISFQVADGFAHYAVEDVDYEFSHPAITDTEIIDFEKRG